MRWWHESIDRLHVGLVSRLAPQIFRHGNTSPSLQEHLTAVQLDLPEFTSARRSTLTARTLVGDLEARIQFRPGPHPTCPLIVYHHGVAEVPYDKTFRGIFRPQLPLDAHVVALGAPFHRSWRTLFTGLATLDNFVAMCAVSIALIEAVRCVLAQRGAHGALVTGTSLGGFLSLMHHLFYGTAERYVPLLAGPDLAHVMLATHYRRFLAPQALAQPGRLQALFDFRDVFQASATHRVFPLLAAYDLDMVYAHHRQCYVACDVPVVTIPRGHITGCIAFTRLRTHLLTCAQPLLFSRCNQSK